MAADVTLPGMLRRQLTPLEPLVARLEAARGLDTPGRLVGRTVRGVLAPGPLKPALSGTWLGHALHPLLTDLVIGSFVSASLLHVIGGDQAWIASERLIAVGIGAYGPTAGRCPGGPQAPAAIRAPRLTRAGGGFARGTPGRLRAG